MSPTDEQRRGMGDNNPPASIEDIDPKKLIDINTIVPLLRWNFAELERRRDELKAGITAWVVDHTVETTKQRRPAVMVGDDQDCGDTLDFLTQLRDFRTKEVEPARKAVKEPVDKAVKAIQAYFADGLAAPIKEAAQVIEDAYSLYLIEKEKAARIRKHEEVWAARQEAARIADDARRAVQPGVQQRLVEQAMAVEEAADHLAHAATKLSPAELSRIRGDLGSVGGLKVTWSWEVENLVDLIHSVAQGQQPPEMLTTNDTFINGLVRGKDGRRKIPGLRIFEEKKGR